MAQYIVESGEKDRYLTPRTLHSSGQDPTMCVLNVTDRYLTLKKGHDIAEAHVISVVEPVPSELEDSGYRACTVQAGDAGQSSLVPGHLTAMYEHSIAELHENQVRQFAQLITEFQDVFAKDEFDLGGFTDI